MIKALNGSLITSIASEEEIVPMEYSEDGDLKPAGRSEFNFFLVSGSVQTGVGPSISPAGYTHATWGTAGNTWKHTASPENIENSNRNIRSKGVGTFNIFW